jgi:hypothetical protein
LVHSPRFYTSALTDVIVLDPLLTRGEVAFEHEKRGRQIFWGVKEISRSNQSQSRLKNEASYSPHQ